MRDFSYTGLAGGVYTSSLTPPEILEERIEILEKKLKDHSLRLNLQAACLIIITGILFILATH